MNKPINASETFIPPQGGYAGLLAYQKTLVVFQGTVRFCERFLEKRGRTVDQMIQAARSGKQNITNYLLDQLIRKLEKAFVEEGGLRERMTRARLTEGAKQKSP
jgi:four helix bundle suffix protein